MLSTDCDLATDSNSVGDGELVARECVGGGVTVRSGVVETEEGLGESDAE